MKNLILLFLALTLCESCFAQNTLKDGKYQLDGKTFKVTKYEYSENRVTFSVTAIGRFWDKPSPPPKDPNGYPTNRKDIHFDINKVKEIINKILFYNKKDLARNKDNIDLRFEFLGESGKIESISYHLNGNTIISLKDIAKIDRELKKSIKATFTGNEYKNFYLISYGVVSVIF